MIKLHQMSLIILLYMFILNLLCVWITFAQYAVPQWFDKKKFWTHHKTLHVGNSHMDR